MTRLVLFRMAIVAVPLFCFSASVSAQSREQPALESVATLAKTLAPTVVQIITPSGTGSGVLIDPLGVVLTNLHVIRGDDSASVRLSNGDVFDDVMVIDFDSRKDIAVLKIKGFQLPAARFGDSSDVQIGDRVYVLGAPRGLQGTLSDGLVSAVRDSGDGYQLLQTNAAISPGSSGGGLFDAKGQLVGLIVSRLDDAANVGFAVPINYARGLNTSGPGTPLTEFAARFPALDPAESDASSPPSAATVSALDDHAARLLASSGLDAIKTEGGWSKTYKGNRSDAVTVTLFVHDDMFVVVSENIVTRPPDAAEIESILEASYESDFAKVSMRSGALIATAEIALATADGPLVKRITEATALLADTIFGIILDGRVEADYSSLTGPGRLRDTSTVDINTYGASLRYEGRDWKQGDGLFFEHRQLTGAVAIWGTREASGQLEDAEPIILKEIRDREFNDVAVIRRGFRTVNGQRLMVIELEGKSQGETFWFFSHVYVGAIGRVHIIGMTTPDKAAMFRPHVESFVAGFHLRR